MNPPNYSPPARKSSKVYAGLLNFPACLALDLV
jgi:hypothetical protein